MKKLESISNWAYLAPNEPYLLSVIPYSRFDVDDPVLYKGTGTQVAAKIMEVFKDLLEEMEGEPLEKLMHYLEGMNGDGCAYVEVFKL